MPKILWLLHRQNASPGFSQPLEYFCPPPLLPPVSGSLCWGCFPRWLISSWGGGSACGPSNYAFTSLGIGWVSQPRFPGLRTVFGICGGGSTYPASLRGCLSVRCVPTWTSGPTPRPWVGGGGGGHIWDITPLPASGAKTKFRSLSTPKNLLYVEYSSTSVISGGEDDCRVLRQHHGGGLPSQGGGHEVSLPELYRSGDPPLVRVARHTSGSAIYSGLSQCLGGHSVSPSPAASYRVVLQAGGVSIFASSVVSPGRLICHLRESQLFDLFLSLPGPSSSGHGRVSPILGRSPGICFSSVVHHSQSSCQTPGVSRDRAHLSGSVLAPEALVSGPPPAVAGTSSGSAGAPIPAAPAAVSSALPGSPQASTSRLETLRRFTRAAGFSSTVASHASLARRPSSRKAYQLKWSVYRSWCHSHGHSVSRPTLFKVADFLCWLQSARGLSVSSIKGYRSMLSAVFRFHLPSLSSDPVSRDLLRSFCISSAERQLRPPGWDLSGVLRFLNSSAFEPLSRAPLRALTQKVLFLLALATVKRVGELQALSSVVTFVGGDACLSYVSQFVAKLESLTCSISRSFLVKSLSDFVAGLNDLLLCPVRAFRVYLDRTRPLAPVCHRLFVSPRRPSRTLSKNAVSFFLRDVITAAGAARPEVGSVRAHDILGVSTSVAFHRNWSVSAVLESATWSSSSVFSSFYLRDIQHEYDGIPSLGPFMAAGSRIE